MINGVKKIFLLNYDMWNVELSFVVHLLKIVFLTFFTGVYIVVLMGEMVLILFLSWIFEVMPLVK